MYNHTPPNYNCPICLGIQGKENEHTLIRNSDIIVREKDVMAFVASYFIETCEGHVVVVPTLHYENLYDIPQEVGAEIFRVSKHLSVVIKKAYNCDGITLLQNNEPAGGQHAFHYHQHLFPRYTSDQLYTHMLHKRETTPQERLPFADKLQQFL